MYRDRYYDPALLDVIFELAGGGGGRAGRIRLWSAIVLVLMAVLGAIGGFFMLEGVPKTMPAATLEDGFHPDLQRWTRRGRHVPNDLRITGRLVDTEAVVFSQSGGTWRCAPLVSDRANAREHPSVYYAASERQYRRSQGDDLYEGHLHSPTGNFFGRVRHEVAACDVPEGAYVLVDDGSLRRSWESGRSLLIIAGVIGSIALIAFLMSLRKQDEPSEPLALSD